jgi:predicted RNase H-like HicB family nuclease
MRKTYLFGISKAGNCYNGFSPDFPGCLVTGSTVEDVRRRLPTALESHIQAMMEDDDPMPDEEDVVEGGVLVVEVPEPIHSHA